MAKVLAADAVLSRADTAVGHWAEHVQAQTNANSGKVTLEEMKATWKRTRLLGPDDVKQYSDALGDYQREKGSCRAVEEASAETTKTLTACADRFKKLSPALEAADAGVGDWKKHLADMQRSAGGHVDNAQTVWLETWAKAPPNIDTFEAATKAVKEAPTCA